MAARLGHPRHGIEGDSGRLSVGRLQGLLGVDRQGDVVMSVRFGVTEFLLLNVDLIVWGFIAARAFH